MHDQSINDAYAPAQIAHLVEAIGVRKANMPAASTLMLGLLAGAFIAFGAMFYTVVITDSSLGFGLTRLVGGLAFSLGLILVVIAGAELFTGNNLIVMAWASGKTSTRALLRNWSLVYAANMVGSIATALLVVVSGTLALDDGKVALTATAIATYKIGLPFEQAFVRGILCNVFVCLAIWLSYASHRVSGKILAIIFPITAFVALGFEHSVANMYFIPVGMIASTGTIDVGAMAGNLLPVTLGNMVGGGGLVAFVYWVIYLRGETSGV